MENPLDIEFNLDQCAYQIFRKIWNHKLNYSHGEYYGWIWVDGKYYWVSMKFEPDTDYVGEPKLIRDLVYELNDLNQDVQIEISTYLIFGLFQTGGRVLTVREIYEVDNY